MSNIQKWLMIDLHTHSKYSAIRKPDDKVKKMEAKDFAETLIGYGIDVFSITDHNYFANNYYDEIDKYIRSKNYDAKIINGVELDVYVDLENKDDAYIHICFYFEDKVDRKLLHDCIEELYSGQNAKPDFKLILNKFSNLNCKFVTIPHGDKDRGLLNHYLIDNIVTNDRKEFYKYAMYKIFNAFDVTPNSINNSENHWANNFYEKTESYKRIVGKKTDEEIKEIQKHIISHIKSNTPLNEDEKEIYKYAKLYGSYFAYFSFSDWHNDNPYNPVINNFIFGCTDYAFNSFELATLDPLSRIQKSKDKKIEISESLLKSVSFKINGKEKNISFSPGLNAIVGKRGSGKSLLVSVIKNLAKSDAPDGALIKYKKLKISDIVGENRGDISLSPGRLSSTEFLTQDEIKNIIDDPSKAQEKIKSKFPPIKNLDLSSLEDIIKTCDLIKPYNTDYKNITTELMRSKKEDGLFIKTIGLIDTSNIESYYEQAINSLTKLQMELKNKGLFTNDINNILNDLIKNRDVTIKKIDFYNNIFNLHNIRVNDFNKLLSTNAENARLDTANLSEALKIISSNLEICLNLKILKDKINNLSINIQPAAISCEGRYLFATYYDFDRDIRNEISNAILDTLTYASDDLAYELSEYVNGNEKRKIKTSYNSLGSGIRNLLNDGFLDSKQSFFEISNEEVDYKSIIKTSELLKEQVELGNLVDLNSASLGMKSVAYLNMLFDLEEKILVFDQPEDNIDNDYISSNLVPIIKNNKRVKQLIFVTHNPSVAVYGDAFNYIYTENDEEITYKNFFIEKPEDKEKLLKILEGGRSSFSSRNKKFGDIIGEEYYDN